MREQNWLGALQVWANSKHNKAEALNWYKRGLELGGSRPLPELFSAAGCKFEFSARMIAPLVKLVREELKKLENAPDQNLKPQTPKRKNRHKAKAQSKVS